MTKRVLLVWPNYYSQYPPLGLLKLSAYHKARGDTTRLVKGCKNIGNKPDIIYITSLFTWAWKPVWRAVQFYMKAFSKSEVWLGGLYATLLPEHALLSGIKEEFLFKGIFKEAENLLPDYSLVPDWDGSIVFSSRGCNRSCGYCAVPILEGRMNSIRHSIKDLVWPEHSRVVLFDNNFLASPGWRSIMDELKEGMWKVDFNQGLDARLITDEAARRISELKIDKIVRLAYDYPQEKPYVERAVQLLTSHGISGRRILIYALYNYTDNPNEFFERVRDILRLGTVCYPMRYQPIYTLEKNKYIAPKWDYQRLELVEKARRVIGCGGALPPYEGLMKKFERAKDFDEAFSLRESKGVRK